MGLTTGQHVSAYPPSSEVACLAEQWQQQEASPEVRSGTGNAVDDKERQGRQLLCHLTFLLLEPDISNSALCVFFVLFVVEMILPALA